MLVMDSVLVQAPYNSTTVAPSRGGAEAATLAARIAKVVEGFRAKNGLGAAIDAALAGASQ